jgi:hypothetical protein
MQRALGDTPAARAIGLRASLSPHLKITPVPAIRISGLVTEPRLRPSAACVYVAIQEPAIDVVNKGESWRFGPMPGENARNRVLQAISSGQLPTRLPRKTWEGAGSGDRCDLCGHPITADQLETEFEDGDRRTYRLHLQCHTAWDAVVSNRHAMLDAGLQMVVDDGYAPPGERSARTTTSR